MMFIWVKNGLSLVHFLPPTKERSFPFTSNNVDIGNYHHILMKGGLGFRQSLGINNHVGADFYYRYSTFKLSENIKEVMPPELESPGLIIGFIPVLPSPLFISTTLLITIFTPQREAGWI